MYCLSLTAEESIERLMNSLEKDVERRVRDEISDMTNIADFTCTSANNNEVVPVLN
jgi:hypothetical protein